MTLLRRRAPGRSCLIHGDNGCEIQGEAGARERAQDKREWRADVDRIDVNAILASLPPELGDDPGSEFPGGNLTSCGGPCCPWGPLGATAESMEDR